LMQHADLVECRLLVVTDRVDLEKQLSGTFIAGGAFGSVIATKKEGEKSKTTSGRDLARRISEGNERIIFTLLQKFNAAAKLPKCKNTSPDLVVLVDEGHRSHGGENHERMRQALPNAAYIAFTGTPLLKDDKTQNKFGPILHAYTMQRAVEDGAVTPLLYEERQPVIDINDQAIDNWFEKITTSLSGRQRADIKKKFATRGKLYGAANRIELIAWDIALHFSELKKTAPSLKGQLATDSKLAAIRYQRALEATGEVTSAVVISPPDDREGHDNTNEDEIPEVQRWWNTVVGKDTGTYEARVIEDFATDGAPDILIVVDKLLTGFDEPRNAVLYIDKFVKEHNLLQAIARVNRLHEQKKHGLLIDYRGILKELDTSVRAYQDLAERTQGGYDIDDLIGIYANVSTEYRRLPGLHDTLLTIFAGVQNKGDKEQYRQLLVPRLADDETGQRYDRHQKIREDFYEALTEFGMCLKLALQSSSFFEDTSFPEDLIQRYKADLKFFTELRKTARRDAEETIDFSEYEGQISRLVDQHVVGEEVKAGDGMIVVDELGMENPETWSTDKTKTETDLIKTRLTKRIEQDLGDDPYAQEVFSDLLRQALKTAESQFDYPGKQYLLFKELDGKVQRRETLGVPDRFGDNHRAKAYYGAFRLVLDEEAFNHDGEDRYVDEALHVDGVVRDAIALHSINPQDIEAAVRSDLLKRYYDQLGGLDRAKALVDKIVEIVRFGTA